MSFEEDVRRVFREELEAALSLRDRALDRRLTAIEHRLQPSFLSREEAAGVARVSIPTIDRWARDGVIKVCRRGRRVLVDPASLRLPDEHHVAELAAAARGGR